MTVMVPATTETIADGGAILRRGGLVAFPTETVYGLGADACSDAAVARIYAAKARPRFNPLIAHVVSLEDAERQGTFSAEAARLARAFWPGPLTLVVPVAAGCSVSVLARAGLDSVALRVPAHPVAQALIAAVGRPVAAPSANRSGRISPTAAGHVRDELGDAVDLILDGGPCTVGLESTIVDCLGALRILRPGGVPREAIEAVLGRSIAAGPEPSARPVAPGQLASHYAPRAAVRLDATSAQAGEAVLDFAGRVGQGAAAAYLDLSPTGDPIEAAANLFAFLRDLDGPAVTRIAVAPIPERGLGTAINDRLRRAAALRD